MKDRRKDRPKQGKDPKLNKQRRSELGSIKDRLESLATELESIRGDLENVRDEEQEYRDNMPESLQESERAYNADVAVGAMEDAISQLEDFDISSIASSIEEAQN